MKFINSASGHQKSSYTVMTKDNKKSVHKI